MKDRHSLISQEEAAKREQICKNFDDHLKTIKSQMSSDVAQSKAENDMIKKETDELEIKYEELKLECAEKKAIMIASLEEQDGKQESIEQALDTQISSQAEEVKKRAEVYKLETAKSIAEEEQLFKVLKEYKSKYQEFQKANKFSKLNQKKFAKDVQILGNHQKQLQTQHDDLMASLDINQEVKDADMISDLIQQKQLALEATESNWE